jgi:serine/threonine-protein kinase
MAAMRAVKQNRRVALPHGLFSTPMTDLRDQLQRSLGNSYTLDRELGGGGMSRVFVATETALGRPVVVKVLPPEMAAGVSTERFKREIAVAARLQHPHIVPLLSAGEMDGVPYFTMPLVEGESLRVQLARHGEMPIADAVRVLREIATALAYAHSHGVVHRDIKPDNVLLSGGTAMVTDFGVAKALSASSNAEHGGVTSLGVALGTPAYMAPEQATADPSTDDRADIYSFGVLAYELLTGQPPFTGRNPSQLLAAQVQEVPEPIARRRSNVPPLLAALVMRCLEKRPADRPQSAADVVHALDDITTPSGGMQPTNPKLRAVPGTVGVSLWRRIPAGALVLAIAAAALGAVGVIVVRRGSTAGDTVAAKRVAVLPFENQGAPEDEYFADGVSDEVRGKLGTIPGLEVIARGSSTPYKNTAKSPQQIAKELGVRYLLTAVVRWEKGAAGSVVHVSPELVEVTGDATPTSRWQRRFDQPLTNVFQVQADIATQVASALNVALGAPVQAQLAERPTQNLAAYDAYLKGVAARGELRTDPASMRAVAALFEQAVALDSTFAAAWAQIAAADVVVYANGVPNPAVLRRAREAADRAIALAPNNAVAHASLGRVLEFQGETERARAANARALELAPNDAAVLSIVAVILRNAGRFDEAESVARRATALDPRSAPAFRTLTVILLYQRRPAQAVEAIAQARRLAPNSLSALESEVLAHLQQGDIAAARRVLNDATDFDQSALVAYFANYWDLYWVLDEPHQQLLLRLTPSAFDDDRATWAGVLAQLCALRKDSVCVRAYADTARAAIDEQLREAPNDAQQHAFRGLMLAYLGRKEEADREAERAVELRPHSVDANGGPYIMHQRLRIHLLLGETDKALTELEQLLNTPYLLTKAWLRIDPNFTPLNGNPRFEKLAGGG